ncbi:MAG: phosphatidylinositol-specific phospholipase C [Planctomycetota bacterium]|nr:phosphatidylinositol-specific phospholipase C [Planctomycetota bacterium]
MRISSFLFLTLLLIRAPAQDEASSPSGVSFDAKPADTQVSRYKDWMSKLPDSLTLAQLSIPGTHDSGARFDGLSFGFAKCQSWSISDQLAAGVRFLDIRCRHLKNEFHIYHGVVDQKLTFESVVQDCQEFLNKHPSECVIMAIKRESTPRQNSRSFRETFEATIENGAAIWWRGSKIPTLKEVRGKIVLVDRVSSLGGLPWRTLNKQDRYTAPVDEKQELIRKQFEAAVADHQGRWHLNYCSGTVPANLLTPRKYAALTNEYTLRLIQEFPSDQHLGTVIMDFPSEGIIGEIIDANSVNLGP